VRRLGFVWGLLIFACVWAGPGCPLGEPRLASAAWVGPPATTGPGGSETGRGAAPGGDPVAAADPGGSGGPAGLYVRLSGTLAHLQRQLNAALARQLRLVRRGEPGAVTAVLLIALAYGVLHALGPGHGKAVVASLFLGHHARLTRGIAVGFLVSFLQVLSSIGTVAVLVLVFGRGSFRVAQESAWAEIASYLLVTGLGLWMTVRALRARGLHGHDDHVEARIVPIDPAPPLESLPGIDRDRATVSALVVAAGLTPCPSGVIVLLFALANHVLAVGLGACLVMAIGMGATVAAIGVVTIMARRTALVSLRARPRILAGVGRGLAVAGGVALTLVGSFLLAGAWTRLP
jgi:nickel/cobalt transporter (NicO) family protein